MGLLTLLLDANSLVLLFVVFVAAYIYMTRNFTYWKRRNVREVPPWAFFGNFAQCLLMRKSPTDFFQELYNSARGEQFVGYFVLDQPQLMIRDPEMIKHVLVKDFNVFHDRLVSASDDDIIGNENLFLVKEPKWRPLRQTMSKFFTSGKMRRIYDRMAETVSDLDKHFASIGVDDKGTIVNINETCFKISNDMIGITAFGMKLNGLNNPKSEFRLNGSNIFRHTYRRQFEFLLSFFIPRFLKSFGIKFFTNSTNFIHTAFQDTLDEKMKFESAKADVYDFLVDLKKEQLSTEKPINFNDDEMIAQVAIYFFAGFGTISTTMYFALYEIAHHPDVQAKLRQELRKAMDEDDGKLSYNTIATLPYLDAVVSEVLRMYPTLPFLDRVAATKYQFPGTNVTIDKGTPVNIPLRHVQMDPDYFPNPEVFQPDRFYKEKKYEYNRFTYFPFGDGPHICIGQRLGLMQTKFLVSHIVSKYELEFCKETPALVEFSPFSTFLASYKNIKLNVKTVC